MKKIIIVGGGIVGASTAYHLAKKGASVTLVDRKDKGQATDAAAGIVCPWISQRRNKAWYMLAKSGAKYYPKLIQQLKEDGESETGYSKVGAISLNTNEEKITAMEKRAHKRLEDAPEIGEITILNSGQAKELFPPLEDGYGAVHVSGAARVDGRALRDALLSAAEKNGAVLEQGDASLLFEGNCVNGVSIGKRTIEADSVIICAGAWANELLAPLGVDFKVSFQKAQIAHLAYTETATSKWPVVMPPSDQYLLAFNDHRIVIGATHENTDVFDCRVTVGGMQEVFNKALAVAPGLQDSSFLEARVGFRPFTPGFLPVIGPIPAWDGIILANGLGSSGLTMGPYIGAQLAELVMDGELEIDLGLYSVAGAL